MNTSHHAQWCGHAPTCVLFSSPGPSLRLKGRLEILLCDTIKWRSLTLSSADGKHLFSCNLKPYSSKVDTNESTGAFFPPLENQKRLSQEEQSLCEGPLRRKECVEALKSMASEKTPGSDGLPCEFYIVKLIPKRDAELTLMKNWRLQDCIKSYCKPN